MILNDFKEKYLNSFKLSGGQYENKITSDFILFALKMEVAKDINIAQKETNNEFRAKYPDSCYTDEELKSVIPIPDADKAIIELETYRRILNQIDMDIIELNQDININNEKIDDPKTFGQEVTELRSELVIFEKDKDELEFAKSIIEDKCRELNEKWTKGI